MAKEDLKKKKEPDVAVEAPAEAERGAKSHLLRGFKDILPSEQAAWDRVRTTAEGLARAYGYERLDTPMLEETVLFTRAVGTTTDVVEKELFEFRDRGGDAVAMRPEGTAPVVRAYIEHGFLNQPQPVKLWYLGPFFRYDRPQAGRLRQFHQFGLEVFGEMHPATDAELIALGANFFRELGISITVQVNSIGCRTCRPPYIEELTTYLKAQRTQLSEESRERLARAPLRVLDAKQPEDRAVVEGAPQMVDWLCEECKQHFIRVLEYLDELEVSYALSPHLVRGLDYYTKTVFEFLPAPQEGHEGAPQSAQSSLGGGGRYDVLVEELGGRPTPATGVAFGVERTLMKMREAVSRGAIPAPAAPMPEVYLAQLGEQAKRKAMKLFEEFRREGLRVAAHFSKDALKAQLEHANRMGVRLTCILGQKEVIDETIIIREMSSGIQETVPFTRVRQEITKRLSQEEVRESREEPSAAPIGDQQPAVAQSRTPIVEDDELADEGGAETPEKQGEDVGLGE